MSHQPEDLFSSHDEPTEPSEKPTYALLPQEWNEMVDLANHLAQREAEMPLRRRMETFLTASNQAYQAGLSDIDDDQRKD